jgi:hypothetical protein
LVQEHRYFDSHLDDVYDKDNIVQMNKDVYYYDVYLFLKQAKSAAIVKEFHLIHTDLHICLCDNTQQ